MVTAVSVFAATAAPTLAKPDIKAIRLIDRATGRMYPFHEVKAIHLYPSQGKSNEQAFEAIQKQIRALPREKHSLPLQGDPASSFCVERMKGVAETFKDLAQNEYAICKLSDGTLVDAWDLFRLLKR